MLCIFLLYSKIKARVKKFSPPPVKPVMNGKEATLLFINIDRSSRYLGHHPFALSISLGPGTFPTKFKITFTPEEVGSGI